MTAVSRAPAPPAARLFGGALVDGRALRWAVAAALLLGAVRRIGFGLDRPLTPDESWTGAIASAPDLATLIHFCLSELNGPVFYGTAWLWAQLAGVGNEALRLPALAATLAMPLLILKFGHPDRQVRWLWAAVAAIWLPASLFAAEARPYALVLLIGTAQAAAASAMLRRPSPRHAWLWTLLTAAGVLTHYHMLPVSGLQGLLIVARGRAAWRCWPALLAFVPVALWISFHLPTLLTLAGPAGTWHPAMHLRDLAAIVPAAMFGLPALGYALLAALIGSLVFAGPAALRRMLARADVQVALSGAGALAFLVLLALIRPSFSPRYILPCMPAILYGMSVWAVALTRRLPLAPLALLLPFFLLALAEASAQRAAPHPRDHAESFEIASAALARHWPTRLVAFFDTNGAAPDAAMMRQVAGFFFARAGQRPEIVLPALADPRTDPNAALPALAAGPGDAILWIYDSGRPGTRGTRFPARIAAVAPRFACRDYGTGSLAVIACWQPRR